MKNENLIHIKFNYDAAVDSKKDILSTEIDLLKINQNLKKYKEYRIQELETKILLERKLRALKLDLGRLQNLLPEVKIPEILEKAHKKIKQELRLAEKPKEQIKEKNIEKEKPKDELESQLQEIQKRLKALSE